MQFRALCVLAVLITTAAKWALASPNFDYNEDYYISSRWERVREANAVADSSSSREQSGRANEDKNIWAVLVAGSNTWWNYRHQADICHAYHILRGHGIPASQIITMMYDDIANNTENPYPGRIFNSPAKKDVYAGVAIDYRGRDVTPRNFAAVLSGDTSRTRGGNGRVLRSTRDDHVFVYFADHGATGILAFPDGEMTMKELSTTLSEMNEKGLYGKATLYVEACESGSMFEHTLKKDLNIYAVTAANGAESSWATYCNVPHLNLPCLGDEFSVNWMEDSDRENLRIETLLKQFQVVKGATKKSHVSSFGENSTIPTEPVGDFQGDETDAKATGPVDRAKFGPYEEWNSRDVPLQALYAERNALVGESGDNSVEASDAYKSVSHRIHVMKKKRRYLESVISNIVAALVHDPVNRQRVLSTYPSRIRKLGCHHSVVKVFSRVCFSFSQNAYALKYAYVLANLCEMGIDQQRLANVLVEQCAELDDIQQIV